MIEWWTAAGHICAAVFADECTREVRAGVFGIFVAIVAGVTGGIGTVVLLVWACRNPRRAGASSREDSYNGDPSAGHAGDDKS
jgi:hypothetical protein